MLTYELAVLLICILGAAITLFAAAKSRLGVRAGAILCICALVCCTVCARGFYILVCDLTGPGFFGDVFPLEPYFYAFGGGVLGYVLALWLTARLSRRTLCETSAVFVPTGLIIAAVLRMAEALSDFGWGDMVEWSLLERYPFAIQNMYGEWCAAVFNLEALAALGVLALVLRRRDHALGLALIWWAAAQIFCESLRIESIQWGFVRVQQLLSAVIIAVVMILHCRRAGKKQLLHSWIGFVLCVGLVIFLEYAIDKMPWPTFLNYIAMAAVVGWMGLCAQRLLMAKKVAA